METAFSPEVRLIALVDADAAGVLRPSELQFLAEDPEQTVYREAHGCIHEI
jgi:hypothetical protein